MGIKLKQFMVVLDNPAAVYRPGEVVSGQVMLQLDGEMHLNQLTIKLKGQAICSWTESKSVTNSEGKSETQNVEIKSKHNCVELLYSPGNVYSNLMGPGIVHNIGFNFQLPPINLPSSFEGAHGHIRYYLKARIHKTPVFSIDDKAKMAITIQSPAFYSIQELTQSVQNSSHKTVGLFGGKSVTMTCHMTRKGHNIGTSIPISCVIDNQSKKSMTLRATLKQEVTYHAEGQTKKTTDKVVVSVGSIIQPKSKQTEVVPIVVPTTAPVGQNSCPILQIRYIIVITLVISGSFDLHCELPVILTNENLPPEFL